MKKYHKLIYQVRLGEQNTPTLDVESEPILYDLHDELNSVLMNRDYFDEVMETLGRVLSGEIGGYSFGYEVYNFSCDKNDCDVTEYLTKKLGTFRTQDMYDMLKYFQQYRDDFYARRNG